MSTEVESEVTQAVFVVNDLLVDEFKMSGAVMSNNKQPGFRPGPRRHTVREGRALELHPFVRNKVMVTSKGQDSRVPNETTNTGFGLQRHPIR